MITGCHTLARVEESLVLTFSKTGDDDPNRLNVLLNYADRVRHAFRAALVLLVAHRSIW